jgi:hypothetical protein
MIVWVAIGFQGNLTSNDLVVLAGVLTKLAALAGWDVVIKDSPYDLDRIFRAVIDWSV